MKVLLYSNMAPSADIQYAGVFVNNQFDYLKAHDTANEYFLYTLQTTFTGLIKSIQKYIAFIYKSLGYIRRGKFDIIHVHYFFPLAVIPWIFKKTRGTKIIVTVHGSDLYAKMQNPVSRSIFRYILKDYDHIICVGVKLGDDFYNTMGIKPHQILCAGVSKQVFLKKDLQKDFDFLFVGTLVNRKGFDIVLKVISATIHKYKWCVVGTGEYKNAIEALAKEHNENCIYYERLQQPELNLIFNRSKWMYFPSRNEPFGLVASESIFSGTPVISSARGGLQEQVKDGINGYIINDPDDVEESLQLLNKAYDLIETDYKAIVENCNKSNDQFSLEYVCDNLIGLYNSI